VAFIAELIASNLRPCSAGNQTVERGLDPFARHMRGDADGIADVDVETLQLTVRPFDSNGGYCASSPKRSVDVSAAIAPDDAAIDASAQASANRGLSNFITCPLFLR
jgi:hypothetical protein